MHNVASFVDEFADRAKHGKKPMVRVAKQYAEAFLGELARRGFGFAQECLAAISDTELRRIVETIFFSTVGFAAAGVAIGGAVAGPPGMQVGAIVGAGLGFAAGCLAVVIIARQDEGPDGPELVLTVA